MFCTKCGNPLAEGVNFCTKCGTPTGANAAAPETPVSENEAPEIANNTATPDTEITPGDNTAAGYDAPVNEAEAAPEIPADPETAGCFSEASSSSSQVPPENGYSSYPSPAAETGSFVSGVTATKKAAGMAKWLKLLLCIGIPVAVVGAAAVLCLTVFKPWFIETFGSDKDYFKCIETKESVEPVGQFVSETYGVLLGASGRESDGAHLSATVTIDEGAKSLISMASSEVDLSWFNSVDITADVAVKDSKLVLAVTAGLNSNKLLSANAILDYKDRVLYVTVPELSSEAMRIDMDWLLSEIDIDGADDILGIIDLLQGALPDEDTVEKLVNRYFDLVLDSIDNVKKSKATVTASGVSEKLKVLSVEVSQKDVLTTGKKLLEAVRDDKDIKKIIENIQPVAEKAGYQGQGLYNELIEEIDESLDDLNEELEDAESEPIARLVDYVSGSKIVGRALYAVDSGDEEERVLYYLLTENGGKFGFEADIDGYYSAEGSGKKSGDKLTGDFTVYEGYEEDDREAVLDINVKDFDCSDALDDGIYGTLTISVPDNKSLKNTNDFYSFVDSDVTAPDDDDDFWEDDDWDYEDDDDYWEDDDWDYDDDDDFWEDDDWDYDDDDWDYYDDDWDYGDDWDYDDDILGSSDGFSIDSILDTLAENGISVSITFDGKNGAELKVSAMGVKLVTVKIECDDEAKLSSSVYTVPSSCIDIADEDDFSDWAETIDLVKVLGLISKSGIPMDMLGDLF